MSRLKKLLDSLLFPFRKQKVTKGRCATRYPLLLVHGIAFRDDMILSSWGRIPEYLRQGGARVFLGEVEAWASYEHNAEHLRRRIDEILAQTGAEKVNIIAHSKGGIDARYAIHKYSLQDKVASLTTICTPHRGSGIANIITRVIPSDDNVLYRLVDLVGYLMGDRSPATAMAAVELTPEKMQRFNEEVKDAEGVYYQSFGSHMSRPTNDLLFALPFRWLSENEGENDGMVSRASCEWGRFRGMVHGKGKRRGISHLQITGAVGDRIGGVNVPLLYVSWVEELKEMGF